MGRRSTNGTLAAALCALLLLAAPLAPAAALAPASPPADAEAAAPSLTIEPEQGVGDDARIAERIRGIFSELPRLAQIEVTANEGVVTLTGTVAEGADRERAAAIAGRVAGVVTVENEIVRDTSVGGATASSTMACPPYLSTTVDP